MPGTPLDQQILEYLIRQPDAKDTLEGIIEWWLPGVRLGIKPDEVERVLGELVAKGWVTATGTGSRVVVYGLQRLHLDDIKRFLSSRRESGKNGEHPSDLLGW
jgi:hypothetical protein